MQNHTNDELKNDGDTSYSAKHSDPETKDKIDRHLKEKADTISEEDINKVNTDIKSADIPDNDKAESDLIEDSKEEDKNNEHPKKEMPTSWDVID